MTLQMFFSDGKGSFLQFFRHIFSLALNKKVLAQIQCDEKDNHLGIFMSHPFFLIYSKMKPNPKTFQSKVTLTETLHG